METEIGIFTPCKFRELPEEIKRKAIEKNDYINVSHEWYQGIFEDSENIGFKILSFEFSQSKAIEIVFMESFSTTVTNILEKHGKKTRTYETAFSYVHHLVAAKLKGDDINEDEILAEEFKQEISKDYLRMLEDEYDYQSSAESIAETLEANEYLFDEDGSIH